MARGVQTLDCGINNHMKVCAREIICGKQQVFLQSQ